MIEGMPYKSMLYVLKAGKLTCPKAGHCIFCEFETFCGALRTAYREAEATFKKEGINPEEIKGEM